jgi:2-succinyl-6-hydroxy-2,4-cyclohexadiene-1-carboxylate synthase
MTARDGGTHRGTPGRETLILLHGFTHTGASWEHVIGGMGERYRALAPDIRGHGAASMARPITLAAVLGDLDRLAPRNFDLVGYSMGGRIALHAALALSARVRRLVLISASPGIADPQERTERRRADDRLASELRALSIERLADRWEQTPVLGGQPPEVAAAARTDRLRNRPEGLALALQGLGTGALPSLWERLAELQIPLLLVVGERDVKFREIAVRMAEAIASAELAVVAGAGHAVHLEQPRKVAGLLEARGSVVCPRGDEGAAGACTVPGAP